MYLRTVHAEHDVSTLCAFIHANPLGILTTAIPSATHHFLQSSHIPWLLDITDENDPSALGTLHGHVARANPQAKAIIADLTEGTSRDTAPQLQQDVLVLFNGPADEYHGIREAVERERRAE